MHIRIIIKIWVNISELELKSESELENIRIWIIIRVKISELELESESEFWETQN